MGLANIVNNILTDTNLTGVLVGNGAGNATAVAGTADQLLRRNAANNGYEFFTHNFIVSGATAGGELSGTYPNPTLLNNAVTGKILTGLNLTGGGTISATDSILTAFGKVQNQISGLVGGVTFQGVWNANTNSPALTSSVGTKGYYYIVDVAGSTNLNGITDWRIGDWAIFNGSTWDKVDNTDAVSSVNGFTGAVSLTTANISEVTNLYYTDNRARAAISLTTTGSSGAATYSAGVFNIPNYTLAGLGGFSNTGSFFIGTTSIAINRASAAQTLTGVSIDGNAGTVGTFAETAFAVNQRGGDIALNATIDSNTLRNGMYRVNSGVTSSPNSGRFWALNVYGNQSNVVSQLASDFQTGQTFIRGYNSAWSAWRRVWDNVNLPSPVTSVSGTGTVSGLTLSGTVTSTGNLTLGGTLSLTAAQVNAVGAITNNTSGNAATVTNGVYTTTFNTLGDARYLQLSGGTLTGALNGTSLSMSGTAAIGGSNLSYTAANRGNITMNGTSGIIGFNNSGTAMGYFFHDGTNMQMWNELNGSLLFGTNATERMRITSGGNVGIGTTSPTARLTVENAGAVAININDNSNTQIPTINLQQGGTTKAFIEGGVNLSSRMDLGVGSTRVMTLINGNVLIGTTTDNGARLQVEGSITSGSITANTGNRTLTFDNITNYGQPLVINAAGSLDLRLQNNGTNSLVITSTGAATFSSSVSATGFFETSDIRLKTLISDNHHVVGIDAITPKLYTKNGKTELGYYAQDLVGVLDSAVTEGQDGMLSLSYREVHTAKIYALEQEIKELKAKLK